VRSRCSFEHAWSAETKVLALDIDDREALLRAMEDWGPPELGELRAVLLQEHVSRQRETCDNTEGRTLQLSN